MEGNSLRNLQNFSSANLPLTLIDRCSSVWNVLSVTLSDTLQNLAIKIGLLGVIKVQLRYKCRLLAPLLATRRKQP